VTKETATINRWQSKKAIGTAKKVAIINQWQARKATVTKKQQRQQSISSKNRQ